MITEVTAAIAIASAIVQPKLATSGWPNAGSGNAEIAYAEVLRPVKDPSPSETSEPIPAASSPGTSTRRNLGPPIAVTSTMRTAAASGELKTNDTAAKLPDAATRVTTWLGAPARTRRIAITPRPAPRAISGASGPITTPNPIAAIPARRIPGSSSAAGGPPAARPYAGMWPPLPGSFEIASATKTPATASTGSGHQTGGLE